MKISDLLQTLEIPTHQREYYVAEFGGVDSSVTCYHVTDAGNVASILTGGLKATECQQGRVTRQAAVYLFLDKGDIDGDTVAVLGIKNPVTLKITLNGNDLLDKANYDGMFNMAFDAYSAIQYCDSIAPDKIEVKDGY